MGAIRLNVQDAFVSLYHVSRGFRQPNGCHGLHPDTAKSRISMPSGKWGNRQEGMSALTLKAHAASPDAVAVTFDGLHMGIHLREWVHVSFNRPSSVTEVFRLVTFGSISDASSDFSCIPKIMEMN